ncbi:molybdopterin converting factor subunit 1 [Thalassotalea crassostreae]|uniref:molybdopterin converting factor subunit 1 n=1 Tax=Thalassotalea crassostreae TaxID=1763536 RepID=UPI000838AB96|nr:molybdopterin converting factor subunit 1 [Thalassotalea crassostreae]
MINVLFFAAIREQLDCEQLEIKSEHIETIADLKQQLATKGKDWQQVFQDSTLLAALNQDMAEDTAPLSANDTVAFFPPVTGG